MRRSFRFWLVYGVAWLPYAASYVALFMSHLGQTFPVAIKASIFSVLPEALLGVGVVAVCERLPWSPDRRVRFLSIHLLLASFYVAVWSTLPSFIYGLTQRFETGAGNPQGLPLQRGFFGGLVIYVSIAGIVYA